MNKIKIAVIGCGKVTETFHLPALAKSDQFEVTALIDMDLTKTKLYADQYNVPVVSDDYKKVFGIVDAAIIALPHQLHGIVGLDLLKNGVHVLIEKPLALTKQECEEMIKAADSSDLVLSVGLLRRYYEASQYIKELLGSNMLGKILSFDIREGSIFNWPSSSDFMFKKNAGGGVLFDTGVHTVDTLIWWLGDVDEVNYYDDAMGGVEANAELHLVMKNGAKGIVELSRTRNLRNTYVIKGELGSLEVGIGVNPEISLHLKNRGPFFTGQVVKAQMDRNNLDIFARQLKDFAFAITNNASPFVSGTEGMRVIEILEACHNKKQQLHEPWMAVPKRTYELN
ncbi:MAG: Gfo/Idh/MocA family oxidoreductase [Balneolales bacterium]